MSYTGNSFIGPVPVILKLPQFSCNKSPFRYKTHKNICKKIIVFPQFPLKNPERNATWIKAVGRKGFIPTKNSRLCNNHFVKSDFKNPVGGSYKLLLRDGAVPSVFNNLVSQPIKKLNLSNFDEPTTSVSQLESITKA